MSDYNPNINPGPGPEGRYDYRDPNDGGGRGGYVMLAVLAAVALVGGLLYFGTPDNDQQAQAPETTMTAPAAPDTQGGPATPMRPATPAPGAPATPPAAQPQE